MLQLYNYLSRKKEPFTPLKKGRVGLYTCGPTVYNYVHIGNLRAYLFDDVLKRALEFFGFEVRHVMNLTDVDDKTIRDSLKAGKTLRAFTDFYAEAFFKDIKRLQVIPAWKFPRATDHIKDMATLIGILLKKGVAYKTDDGIYFSIRKFASYGKLSRVKSRNLKAGARVSRDEYSKAEANDFALWKFKKAGEPSWNASFGAGRPGWHIECSAMSMKYLGKTFDIHAGGVDLLFPHHEDEIAQSEAATGKPFVRYFVENEHLLVDGKKMSKSLGNVYRLRDLEARGFDPLDFRYFVLGAHYRTPLNFTWAGLRAAKTARARIGAAMMKLRQAKNGGTLREENEAIKVVSRLEHAFREALADDLNTPKALAILNELIHYGTALAHMKRLSGRTVRLILAAVKTFDRALGLKLLREEAKSSPAMTKELTALVRAREKFRREKNWKEADAIRAKLKALGYSVEDTPNGPQLKKL